ncbi:hypothetical protein AHAS_Ahas10G0069400 [Arachis hypogaea]
MCGIAQTAGIPLKKKLGGMRRPIRVHSNYYDAEDDDLLDGCQGTMNLAFQPQNDMNLSPVEMAMAAYIFCRDLPPSELLVDVGNYIASSAALMTLVP